MSKENARGMQDDMISKRRAIDALTEYGNGQAVYISVEEAVRRIEQLPPIQPVNCSEFPNNSDTISRQSAIKAVQNRRMMLTKEKVLLINDLEKLPSAEPEIVQCKDCKHFESEYGYCDYYQWNMTGGDFCSKAEKREVTT